jgi:hypothetical protein
MYLKLSINCVRKVKWFAKLGFLNPQKPLCISFKSIKQNSQVGAIDCKIEKIYPILVIIDKHHYFSKIFFFISRVFFIFIMLLLKLNKYVEKLADGSKIYRNQKQEELAAYKYQTEKYKASVLNSSKSTESQENDQSLIHSDNNNSYLNNDNFNRRNVTEILKIRVIEPIKKIKSHSQITSNLIIIIFFIDKK